MDDDSLRQKLKATLAAGLETNAGKRADTSENVNSVVARLQRVPSDDYENKLVTAGFTLTPYVADEMTQSCATCMYYLKHRRFCELPELKFPVEPEWSCILWRV